MAKKMFENLQNETLWEKIQSKYWKTWPYDLRPGQIWYRLKCFCWYRYSTVKPKDLPHTWCDRDHLLFHCNFEIFSKFIEEECSPGHIDWYYEGGHIINVDGEDINVRDEMQRIYNWWKDFHVYEEVEDIIFNQISRHKPFEEWELLESGNYLLSPKFYNEEDKIINTRLSNAWVKLEETTHDDINNMLHRLINIRQYMWT